MGNKVGIILLNYNNWNDTITCIESLDKIVFWNRNIYIVDNDSPNDSYERLNDFLVKSRSLDLVETGIRLHTEDRKVNLIKSPKNGGYAAGNNVGIRLALQDDCDYVLILNNDTLVTTDFLNELVDFSVSNDVILCGPKIIDTNSGAEYGAKKIYKNLDYLFVPPSIFWHYKINRKRTRDVHYDNKKPFTLPFEMEVLSGSCMLIRNDYFKEFGLLDESTFLYMEEMILAKNALDKGIKTYCVPSSRIQHEGGSSTSTTKKTFITREFIKSCRYFMTRYQHYSTIKANLLLSGFYLYLFALYIKSALGGKQT